MVKSKFQGAKHRPVLPHTDSYLQPVSLTFPTTSRVQNGTPSAWLSNSAKTTNGNFPIIESHTEYRLVAPAIRLPRELSEAKLIPVFFPESLPNGPSGRNRIKSLVDLVSNAPPNLYTVDPDRFILCKVLSVYRTRS